MATPIRVPLAVSFLLLSGAMCQQNKVLPDLLSVNAGPDQDLLLLATATLSGSATGGIGPYTFEWSKVDGPDQGLAGADASTATVTALNAGTTTFQFNVTDSAGATLGAVVKVNVQDRTPDGSCIVTPVGLIQQRWNDLGGATGPLGCPAGVEADVPGRNGRKMPFENGEAVWSPDQDPNLVVAAYQQDDNIIVNWGDTAPNEYDKFTLSWARDGANLGQADAEYVDRGKGFFAIRAGDLIKVSDFPGHPIAVAGSPLIPGLYSIQMQCCIAPAGIQVICPGGSTIPVNVRYSTPPLPPHDACIKDFEPYGLIGERWAELGAAEGPLGCPVEAEHDVQDRNGRAQSFEHGSIVFSPDQGAMMTVAAYAYGTRLAVVWGSTAPSTYNIFKVSWDQNGANLGEAHAGSGTGGFFLTPELPDGDYDLLVDGCVNVLGQDVTCPQGGTIPAHVHKGPAPTPPAPANQESPPPPPECPIEPIGLIAEHWSALGGKAVLGCPTQPEQTFNNPSRIAQRFDHGEIVFAPTQGDKFTLAVYQLGQHVVADWRNTDPHQYNIFKVRIDYEGQNLDEVTVTGGPTNGGRWEFDNQRPDDSDRPIVDQGEGWYSAVVRGCIGSELFPVCSDYSPPAFVYYKQSGEVDLQLTTTPKTVDDAVRDKSRRALAIAKVVSDRQSLNGDWGDDQVTAAIAMFYLLHDDAVAGRNPAERRRARDRFPLRTEINDALRAQIISANTGTDSGSPCTRAGDYDVVLKGYIPIIYRYPNFLDRDVHYRLLHLLNKYGPHNGDDDAWNCVVSIPETENHRLMIESSRYLTNQLFFKLTGEARFDNSSNAGPLPFGVVAPPMNDYILQFLQDFLKNDFVEYNSRPYGRYTWAAIQNLYDYADDGSPGGHKVKVAAQMVLDYLSAKVAVSSRDGRRNPPYRRRASHNHPDFFHPQSDPVRDRFLLYTAPTLVMQDFIPPNWVKSPAVPEMLLAAVTNYQPPNLVLDLLVNPDHQTFFQRFQYRGTAEVYSAERDFLISAGGLPTSYAYTIGGLGCPLPSCKEDLGVAEPTCLIPTGQISSVDELIHFAPAQQAVLVGFTPGNGVCVAPDFACGLSPVIPSRYIADGTCFISSPPWTFIDYNSNGCKGDPAGVYGDFGFFVAVYGAGTGFGFMDVVPKSRLKYFVSVNDTAGGSSTEVPATLQDFANIILSRNAGRQYNVLAENTYTTFSGNTIHFNLTRSNPIVSTGLDLDANNPDLPGWPLAQGDVINSDGHSGLVTISNPFTGEKLLLDFRDRANPVRTPQ